MTERIESYYGSQKVAHLTVQRAEKSRKGSKEVVYKQFQILSSCWPVMKVGKVTPA